VNIVSLLPSATEICFALGLDDTLVGVTHECDYPAAAFAKPQVTSSRTHDGLTSREIDTIVRSQLDTIAGGTGSIYELSFDKLEALRPDLILTQRLCTVCAVSIDQVREIAARLSTQPEVVNLEPRSLDEVFETIERVAKLTGVSGENVLEGLKARIERVRQAVEGLRKPKVLVLEWIDPPFASGHWIPELVEIAGGENTVAFMHAPSREVAWERVMQSGAEIIVVAECGFGIERQKEDVRILLDRLGSEHRSEERDMPEVWVCDGSQYFSRPGPRLVDTVEMLAGILHSELREEFFAKFQIGHDITNWETIEHGTTAL
jgi:iron complex transport system substrate-binding protein